MKNLSLALATVVAITTISSCQRANQVRTIDTSTDNTVATFVALETAQPTEQKQNDLPVLYASAENQSVPFTVSTNKHTAATKEANAKMKANTKSVRNSVAVKSPLSNKLVQKIITKRVQKLQQKSVSPKADKTNTIALISAIAAVVGLGLLFIPGGAAALSIVLGLAAMIMGFVGKGQIKRNGDRGMGWALVGIIGGLLILILFLVVVVWAASILGGL